MQEVSRRADAERLKQEARWALAKANTLFNLQHPRRVPKPTENQNPNTITNSDPQHFLQEFNRLTEESNHLTQPLYPDPILTFPPEIWQECLRRASAGAMGGLLTFVQVSRQWALQITQCPILWRDIHVDSSETAVEVLYVYSELASDVPTNITLSWPLSQILKDSLSVPLSKCYRLNLRLQEGVFIYDSYQLHGFLRSYDMPLLEHLVFSNNFDAKASDAMSLLRAPRIRLVEGISTDISPSVHGYVKFLPGFPASSYWKFRKSSANPAKYAFNCPAFDLIRTDKIVSDFRPELTSLQIPSQCDLSWLSLSFPALKELLATIKPAQFMPVIELINGSPLLTTLKLVVYTKGELPAEVCAGDLPSSSKLEGVHLEISLEARSSRAVAKPRPQVLSAWLVRLLASFLQTNPPICELTFRAADGPLDQKSSNDLLNLLNENRTLSHWIVSTELSLDGSGTHDSIFLPNLRKLTLLQADLLSMIKAPILLVLEFISRPSIEAQVNIPSLRDLASNLPNITTIQYNMSRRVGQTIGLYNSICIIDFMKHTPDPECWPSRRVDDFCKILLDNSACPMVHTIGSDICPGWNILFRLLSRRNVFSQLETSCQTRQPEVIRRIRLSVTPHPNILSPLVRLLEGLLPTKVNQSVISVESYVDTES